MVNEFSVRCICIDCYKFSVPKFICSQSDRRCFPCTIRKLSENLKNGQVTLTEGSRGRPLSIRRSKPISVDVEAINEMLLCFF